MADKLVTNRDGDEALLSTGLPPSSKRAAKPIVPKATPAEESVVQRAAVDAQFFSARHGDSPEQQLEATAEAIIEVTPQARKLVTLELDAGVAPQADPFPFQQSMDTEFRQKTAAAEADEVSGLDMVEAAYLNMYPSSDVFWGNFQEGYNKADPLFDYNAIRMDVEAEFPEESDKQYLRESRNQQMLDDRLASLRTDKEQMQVVGAHGTTLAVAASLTAGIADPVGWAAGFGTGKVAQVLAVGTKAARTAAMLEGTPTGTVLRAAEYGAEGAVGNVLATATIDAMGGHVTNSDYVAAAGFGTVFGQLQFLSKGDVPGGPSADQGPGPDVDGLGARLGEGEAPVGDADPDLGYVKDIQPDEARARLRAMLGLPDDTGQDAVVAAGRDMEEAAAGANAKLYSEAQRQAGPDATPEEIKTQADELVRREVAGMRDSVLTPIPAGDRLFADGLLQPDESIGPLGGGLVPAEAVMRPLAEREAALGVAGIPEEIIADPAKRSLLGEVWARALTWSAQNPLNADRISVMNRVPWLRGTGNALASSDHPVAKWIAGTLLESPAGALGRRRTAANTKAMKHRMYLERHAEYNDEFVLWRNRNGGHAFSEVAGSTHRQRFNRAVYEEILSRDPELPPGSRRVVDPSVGRAADALEAGYNQMRVDAKYVGTIGSARFADHSRGYIQRRLGVEWVRTASPGDRAAVVRVWADQLSAAWDDPQFATKIASQMMERARLQAAGGVTAPANISSPEGSEIIRDLLRKDGVPQDRIELLMGRFSRGGAGFTKKRLDLDLEAVVTRADGSEFKLIDAYETDVSKLYREYANRMSGEVALSQFGVPGEQGMTLLREALMYGGPEGRGVDDEVLEAFDQIRAEMAGRAIPGTKYNKVLGNLRLLTAASRLGGQAFTQFAEVANGIGTVGAAAALRTISQLPRLIQDVRLGRANPLLDSLEVHGGPIGTESRVIVPLQDSDDVRVYGQDAVTFFDRAVRAGANAVPWVSGMHHMQMAQTRGFTEEIVKKAMRYIREGKEDTALAGMGIDANLSARLRAQLDNIAEFDDRGVLTALDLDHSSDMEAVADFVQAVHRGAHQIIQKQYIGETGKWAHNDLLRLLVQFRSFSIISMEKQWTRQRADVGTANAVGLLLGSMAFALPVHIARVNINSIGREDREEYLDRQLSVQALGRATLNYVSLSGLSGDVLDTVVAAAGGEASGVRTGRTDVLGQVPGLGYVTATGQALVEKDAVQLVKQLPGANLPYMMPWVNIAKD